MDNTLRLDPQFARDHKQTYYYTIYIIIIVIICSETETYAIIIVIILWLKFCTYVPPLGKVNNEDQISIRRTLKYSIKSYVRSNILYDLGSHQQ